MAAADQTVLITGASSGIGEALAWIFAEHGYELILVARSADKLDALADELATTHNVLVSVHPSDLSEPGSAGHLARVLQREGHVVDVLVNNAGVLEHGAFVDIAPEDHQRMVQLNVAGLTDVLAHFVPGMVERESGKILNVASIGSFLPIPSLATYAATKAYVLSLSEALGEELRGSGVSVTALCPGVTATQMMEKAQAGSESLTRIPRMMVSDVEDVAREAFKACMKGEAVVVPGSLNLAGTLMSRATPKWLVRRLGGWLGRSTLD